MFCTDYQTPVRQQLCNAGRMYFVLSNNPASLNHELPWQLSNNKPKERVKCITHTRTDVTNTYQREAGRNMFTFVPLVNEKLKTGNVFNKMTNQ